MPKTRDAGSINYDLSQHLIALASTLEAFEVAAKAAEEGESGRLSPWGMFTQCSFSITQILDLHHELETALDLDNSSGVRQP